MVSNIQLVLEDMPHSTINKTINSVDSISDSYSETEVLKGQLLQVTAQHFKTGCEGTLSVFMGDTPITDVADAIDHPEVLAQPIIPLFEDKYRKQTSFPGIQPVLGLDDSVSYSTQSMDLRVGCDCCEISWERATKGIFKAKKATNDSTISYIVQNDNYNAIGLDNLSPYSSLSVNYHNNPNNFYQ